MDTSLTDPVINAVREGDEIKLSLPHDENRCAVVLITESHCRFRPPNSCTWHRAENERDAVKRAKESLLQCPIR